MVEPYPQYTMYRAYDQIAALANEWNCPVLSNDSDFFIYDVKAGFILIDYLNLQISKLDGPEPITYLNVQIYYMDSFIKQLKGADRDILALFATLIGNDFVDIKTFETFYAKVKLPSPKCKRFSSKRESSSRMISLLLWLESQQNVDDAVEVVLSYIPKDRKESVKKKIQQSINSYTKLSTNLIQYFGVSMII